MLSEDTIKRIKILLSLPEDASIEDVNEHLQSAVEMMDKAEAGRPLADVSKCGIRVMRDEKGLLRVVTERQLHSLSAAGIGIADTERAVMKQLGLSEAEWLRADALTTLNTALGIGSTEREVMRQLGITEAQWRQSALLTGLVALDAPAKLSSFDRLPTRLVMLKWGVNETAEGDISVGLRTLQASTLWDSVGFGEVAIDFNHNTVPGHPSYQGEPAPIAAMANPRVIAGEGLVFENIRWTPEGVANREHYPDLSPAVKTDESGEVIFCHSAALARNGAVRGLHLCSVAVDAPGISSADRQVMRMLNISEAQWLNAR